MNNYHLYLIRPGAAAQFAAHLLAGILALILFFRLGADNDAPARPATGHTAQMMSEVTMPMPVNTAVLAAGQPRVR